MENHYREEETYKIIGICMEVHRNLGPGLLEVIYKDALEIEFKENDTLVLAGEMKDIKRFLHE